MRHFACLLVFLAIFSAASAQEARTWTDSLGRQMQAQFVREVDGDVTFIKDGKLITFPLDQLSEADQKFIRDAESEKKVEETARPAGAPAKNAGPDGLLPPADSLPTEAKSNLTKQRTVAEERTWRDARGKQTVGKFVRMHDGNVVILRGGRVVTISFNSLSRADREYVRELLAARGETAQLPPEPREEAVPFAPSAGDGGASAGDGRAENGPPAGIAIPPGGPRPGGGGAPATAGSGLAAAANERMAKMQQESRDRLNEMQERQKQNAQRNAELANQSLQRLQSNLPSHQESPSDIVGSCSNCKKIVTREESQGHKCPQCGVIWMYEVDAFGRKKEIPGAAAALAASGNSIWQWGSGWKFENRHVVKLFTRIIIPLVVMLLAGIGAAFRARK